MLFRLCMLLKSRRLAVRRWLIPVWEAQLDPVSYNEDQNSEDYGAVSMYSFTEIPVQQQRSGQPGRIINVHPDRVIILAEGSDDGRLDSGESLLEEGFNKLMDLEKVSGGAAEGFLKNASRQLNFNFSAKTSFAQLARALGVSEAQLSEGMDDQVRRLNDSTDRYYAIKVALKALFDQRLTGREREVNSHNWHFLCHDHGADMRLYQVNAGKFIYDISAQELADLLEAVQGILDDYLLEGGEQNLWAMDYVVAEAQRGTLEAFNNLSQQSQVYASQTTLQQLLSSPAYLNQIAAARLTTFSDWKVISDTARGDLANIITDAVARGVNPRETASVISKRLDVSMSKAKTIAQTEQVGALRQAQWNETDWAADRLGLNTGLLWLSALKPTTRTWHASRHGKVYTTEEVRDFYAENGNRYNCYCSQIPVLLNDDGSIFNKGLAEKLANERKQWNAVKDQ